ncbi:MAG: toll/interleukin-1 receptor domain-containing protein [Kineosporiaceae bacterium]
MFVNYRRDDAGWTANAVYDALCQQLGPSRVFLDHRSIGLGAAFESILEDGVRRSAVLVVLIGRRWDEQPLRDRLEDPDDWVRKEILLARTYDTAVVPALVDRQHDLRKESLPQELQFLAGLQSSALRQAHPEDTDQLARIIMAMLPPGCRTQPQPAQSGVECTRPAMDALLRRILPPAQQASGNRERLLELCMSLLTPRDRLVDLAPARLQGRPNGSAVVILTSTDVVIADVDTRFRIVGEIRFPRAMIVRAEVVPTRRLGVLPTADVALHSTTGVPVELLGLFRDQARRLADRLSN